MIEPRRSIAGRRKRSLNGRCSSTSSSVNGFSPPYTERRCCTISAVLLDGVRARPMKIISTPSPANSASTAGLISYLDRDHTLDDQVTDEDHGASDDQQDPADDAVEHRPEIRRSDEVHEGGQHDWKERDQGARGASLCRQGRDLTFDPDPLANRIGDVVEDLREVSTDRSVDRIRGGHEVEVRAHDALGDVLQRLIRRATEAHLP